MSVVNEASKSTWMADSSSELQHKPSSYAGQKVGLSWEGDVSSMQLGCEAARRTTLDAVRAKTASDAAVNVRPTVAGAILGCVWQEVKVSA